MNYAIAAIIGYLLGAVPTSVIVSKRMLNDDIRKRGSGNPGTGNVMRSYGFKYGVIVLAGDLLKGFLATLIGGAICGPTGAYIGMLAAVVGHNWPVYLGFKGGKGIAATLGAMLFIMPLWTVAAGAVFGIFLLIFRYFSLASLSAMIFLWCIVLFTRLTDIALVIVVTILMVMALVRHRGNIERVKNGTETKVKL